MSHLWQEWLDFRAGELQLYGRNRTKSYWETELCLQHVFINYGNAHRTSRSMGKGACLLIVVKKELFFFS